MALHDTHIYPLESQLISTGVKVEIPRGYVGLLDGRSSLNTKLNCIQIPGKIDSDYRGTILTNVFNTSQYEHRIIKAGTPISQLVVVPIYMGDIEEVEELSDTERGEGGFGSTGGYAE